MAMKELYAMVCRAEEAEAAARALREKDGGAELACGSLWGEVRCTGCGDASPCEGRSWPLLFQEAWRQYREAEAQAREEVAAGGHEDSIALLARLLLDIHIHPGSGYQKDLWLQLFYRTGHAAYMERAKLCEGIRRATVAAAGEGGSRDA